MDRLKITYSRSSGPGGQNVNMVNSKVDLRFNVQKATWISDDVKTKLLQNVRVSLSMPDCYLVKCDSCVAVQNSNK